MRTRDERKYRAVMEMLRAVLEMLLKIYVWAAGLLLLMMLLFWVEATGGHDGWLCEWGYDSDGAGDITSGCG